MAEVSPQRSTRASWSKSNSDNSESNFSVSSSCDSGIQMISPFSGTFLRVHMWKVLEQKITLAARKVANIYKGIPHSLHGDCTWVDTWVDSFQVSNASALINEFSKHHQAFCRQQPKPECDFKTKTCSQAKLEEFNAF